MWLSFLTQKELSMSIKRISRRRVVAPIVEHVDKESLATTKEGRKTPQDNRHAPGKGPNEITVSLNKASVPTNKFTPPY